MSWSVIIYIIALVHQKHVFVFLRLFRNTVQNKRALFELCQL